MIEVEEQLESLRCRIAARNEPGTSAHYSTHLAVTKDCELFHLDFFGDAFNESCLDLFKTLARPNIAPHVRSLILLGPDEGANGTHNWNLEPLLAHDATFSQLESFSIQQDRPGDHNRTIVGDVYEEAGVLGRLLAKFVSLRELTVPSAPQANFFNVGPRPLRYLSVDAGYDTQGFIRNLACSSTFRDLTCLEWGEYKESYTDDFRSKCTPLEDYRVLFSSAAFASVKRFVWRNPICSPEEISGLKRLRPDLQLLVVRSTAEYIR